VGKVDQRRKSQPASLRAAAHAVERRGTNRIWRGHAWRVLALWVLIFAAYSNSFQAGMLFDSAGVIGEDPRIRGATLQNMHAILNGPYWYINSGAGLYRPLTTLSYLLNYTVLGNGTRPVGYHWVNLAVHATNVPLVYALGLVIFEESMPAVGLAAIWGLHPLLTESVTNVVGRADLLAAFGVLLGLLSHARGVLTGKVRVAWLAVLAAGQTIGLSSKENAAVLPGLMLLYDLTWSERSTWRRRLPSYAAVALPIAAFFYLRGGFGTHMLIEFTENPLVSAGFWSARVTAVKVIGELMWLFAWPAYLSADYSYNAVPIFGWRLSEWEDVKALIALAACAGAVVLSVLLVVRGRDTTRGTAKALLFFLLFFFIALSPTSNLIVLIGSIMAERFVYLPSFGLAGCVIAAVRMLNARSAWTALGLVCLAFAARTYARNFDWQDDRSLWSSAVNVYPESARPHYNLATALAKKPAQLPEAIAEFEAALRIRPDYAEAHYNLANALARVPGRLPEAVTEYRAALRSQPGLAEAHYSLANALSHMPGHQADALEEYAAALRIQPAYVNAHNNLGTALARMPGRLPDAIGEFQAALQIRPDYADAHINLGNALAQMPGRLPDAIAEYQAALRIAPDQARAHSNLADALAQLRDRLPEAIAEYQAALQIRPNYPEAHYGLANLLAQAPGRLPDAIAEYEAALRSDPDFAEAHLNLGNALMQIPGRRQDAIAEYEAALRIRPDSGVRRMVDRLRAERR
jgi:tetratricopeptide (TPR) repeat protein